MCGRFILNADFEEIRRLYSLYESERYVLEVKKENDIYPTNRSPVIVSSNGHNIAQPMAWGFEAHGIKRPIINARLETLLEKRMFASRMSSGRCIVPATAFYEWETTESKTKIKHAFTAVDISLISFAGLYSIDKDGDLKFTIITCESSGDVAKIHSRMPLSLATGSFDRWLDSHVSASEAYALLQSNHGHYRMIS